MYQSKSLWKNFITVHQWTECSLPFTQTYYFKETILHSQSFPITTSWKLGKLYWNYLNKVSLWQCQKELVTMFKHMSLQSKILLYRKTVCWWLWKSHRRQTFSHTDHNHGASLVWMRLCFWRVAWQVKLFPHC